MTNEIKLTRFLVEYTRIPTNSYSTNCAVVESDTGLNAIELLKRRLSDLSSLSTYHYTYEVYDPKPIVGEVISILIT